MKKLIIFLRIYWKHILLIILALGVVSLMVFFIHYSFSNFSSMSPYSRKTYAGMAAMQLPSLLFAQLLMIPAMFLMYWYFFKGGGIGRVSRTRTDKDGLKVTWDDIIGMKEAKQDAQEIVKLLKDHALQKATAGHIIKGTIMIGPPGCGKTYLAKAIATECGLPMLSCTGSEFIGIFVGQGTARVKSLFKEARTTAKIHDGCIVFIDEIDAFARPRQDRTGINPSIDTNYNATINQFLTEMDGLRKDENNIVIIAASNVKEEELEPALMRSGRFDRKIRISRPNATEREELLKYYLGKVQVEGNINIEQLAEEAKWFSPSDINNMVKEAGILASRGNHSTLSENDLKEALRRVMISIEKTGEEKILSSRLKVKWDDVIGMEDAKTEAWELVKLLKDRNLCKAIGGKIIKGMVLFGPPGCGKTYLVKAIATECGFPLISKPGSEFVGTLVGEGQKRMKALFEEARNVAKAEGGCIIFFDEIDSFARGRVSITGWGGGISHNATINQFLTEIDGLRQEENNIVVIGATNAKESELDSAVMRAGRLERKIYVSIPTQEDREKLFAFYLSKVSVDEKINVKSMALRTIGFTPADIDNMIREAGLIAMRSNRDTITTQDLSEAYDRITMGAVTKEKYKKSSIKKTAYHEAGHAIIAYLCHPTQEPIKATVRPRKGTLGFIYATEISDLKTSSANKEHYLADIQVSLAGYAAEKIVFGTTCSGVAGDFEHILWYARVMVWMSGMGPSGLLGNFTTLQPHEISEQTKQILDQDVQTIINSCLQKTMETLTKHRDLLNLFAERLIEKQDLEYEEIVEIFNQHGIQRNRNDDE